MYRLPSEVGKTNPAKELDWFFDCLERPIRKCPVEGCSKTLGLAVIIVHLNDDHCWTREQIASWVAGE